MHACKKYLQLAFVQGRKAAAKLHRPTCKYNSSGFGTISYGQHESIAEE
jgi:hypothetical protein